MSAINLLTLFRYPRLSMLAMLFCTLLLGGCASGEGGFSIKDLAKSDTDLVTELHRARTRTLVEELMTKLYRRNPRELAKVPGQTIESRWQMIIDRRHEPLQFAELNNQQSVDAMQLGLSSEFQGDRVFAVIVGLAGMLREAYGYRTEFYLLDSIDQQKLYNSARNLEVLAWLLRSRKDQHGNPLLLADTTEGDVVNLSFERLFGKLIAHQDMLAAIIADKTQRTINGVAHGVVSTFLPI